jgi:hypothetical protein
VSRRNLCSDADYPEVLHGLPQSLQPNSGILPQSKPQPIPFVSFPIHNLRLYFHSALYSCSPSRDSVVEWDWNNFSCRVCISRICAQQNVSDTNVCTNCSQWPWTDTGSRTGDWGQWKFSKLLSLNSDQLVGYLVRYNKLSVNCGGYWASGGICRSTINCKWIRGKRSWLISVCYPDT